MKVRTIFFFLLFFSTVLKAQNVFITDSLDNYVNREMKRWNIPGLALAVVKDGKVVVMKGYGVREAGTKKTVDENTLFQIASNTKAFTGTCISILNVQKRLSLDDKVTKWIPDFQLYDTLASRDATVRDMLCHRIGFRTFQSDFLNWNCNMTREELIRNMRNVKPEFSFRSRYGYCNMGFVVAGDIVKQATDTTWENYVKVHLLDPLKMSRTFTDWSVLGKDDNVAIAHTIIPVFSKTSVKDSLIKIPHANIDNIGPCASFNSCVKDLANWLMMQLDSGKFEGNQIVPFPVLRETWRSQMIVNDPSDPLFPKKHFGTYGLGWQMYDYAGRKTLLHGGGTNGIVTRTLFVPEERLGIIVLTNTDENSLYDMLATQILESYLGMPYRNLSAINFESSLSANATAKEELKKLKDTVAMKLPTALALKAYTGKYFNEVYGNIEIKNEGGRLNIYFSHHPQNIGALEPLGGNNFLCTYSDATSGIKKIVFTADNQNVKSVTVRVNDFIDFMPYEFIKVN